jgi:hypothetical protein
VTMPQPPPAAFRRTGHVDKATGKLVRIADEVCSECGDGCNVELVRVDNEWTPRLRCSHCRTDHRYLGRTVTTVIPDLR